jgi:carbamoyl-phosphate synthase large subunit
MLSAAASPVAPSIIRHLQALGHYVIGHDSLQEGLGAKFCDEFHLSPNIATHRYAYIQYLGRTMSSCGCYFPFLDEELTLDFGVIPDEFISPRDTLDIFTSKNKQQRKLGEAGLLPAPTMALASGKAVCKPDLGRGGKGVFFTEDQVIIGRLSKTGYLCQQQIDGDEYTIDVLCGMDGKMLFAVPRLRIQAANVSTVGRIKMDERLIWLAEDVTKKFYFRGPINIQVIVEKDTGVPYIIEVNPRLSGSCMFTVMAGFDILDATIRMHEGKEFKPPNRVDEILVRRRYVES